MLVVDDSASVREGVWALVSGEPALRLVGAAANGTEGLERARALRPDLVVLDQEMPGLTGIEVLRELRRTLPGTQVALFTMSLQVEGQALALGAAAVVSKEDPGLLLATLRRLAREIGPVGPDARDGHRDAQERMGR